MTDQNINKYHNGKIYTIRSPHTNMFYIGSTCDLLCKRFWNHKSKRKYTSTIIIDYGDAYIELLENFKCENKNELNKREGELIRLHKNDIVNHQIAGRTKTEYYNDNKNIILEKIKQYQNDNKNKIKERKKQYYLKNKIIQNNS
jgi:hypothetical protein